MRIGGAQRICIRDANAFAGRGHEISFFILYGDPDTQPLAAELDTAIRLECVHARGPFDLAAAVRIVRVCRAQGIRTLISTLNDANLIARWVVIASGGRIRLFLREANDPKYKTWWQRIMSVLFDGSARRVIAVTDQIRTSMLKDAPWRSRKIIVLHNGIEVPPLQPRESHMPVRILTVGRLTEQKDHSTLIEAVQELTTGGVPCKMKIIGEGPLMGSLKAQAAPLDDRVRFAGMLDRTGVEREYRAADIFVLSSKWEGCPNVILEAMAFGLPVVATRVGGVPELVEDDKTGILIRPSDPHALADALKRLITDTDLRITLGKAGYQRARTMFSNEKRFERLIALLKQ